MTMCNENATSMLTPIQNFYANSKIFITGGTGFLGNVLVEKLLRSCPNISTIYILMRPKNGKSVNDRINIYFDNILFDRMKQENPNYKKQVVGIHGDISESGLALNDEDRIILIEEVNIVFHAAATVNFNEMLQKAIFTNIRGTKEVIALCRQMKNLKFITHVSTAYVHCGETVVEEIFYKTPFRANELITIAKNTTTENLNELTKRFVENYANTYTFSKSISEELIESSDDLPIAVYRPAIVVSTFREPIPGWLNNIFGPGYSTVGRMLGLLRCYFVDTKVGANIVPVDMCANTLIAIPWLCRNKYETAMKSEQNYKISIYNYETNTYRYLSWRKFLDLTLHFINKYPSNKMISENMFVTTKRSNLHKINVIVLHYTPAFLIDAIYKCFGKKSKLLQQYKTIDKLSDSYKFFANRHWNYKSDNLIKLCDSMTQEDKKMFFCDLRKLDWNEYLETYIIGCRTYLLEEEMSTLKVARKRQFYIKFATRSIFLLISYWLYSVTTKSNFFSSMSLQRIFNISNYLVIKK